MKVFVVVMSWVGFVYYWKLEARALAYVLDENKSLTRNSNNEVFGHGTCLLEPSTYVDLILRTQQATIQSYFIIGEQERRSEKSPRVL